ncbi:MULTISPECIES: hypothetical protein [Gordonia]|uniref:Uncharacterized protein n=1 Tax=Gordonia amicalis TaxID=89053 RepID=A0ABU4D7Q9_9ACTN|nr:MULTISPECIES: hypothetical protein [Gordonia]MCZ4581921.1 hypothetical protein [Gordonia amicalis]MCZ4651131.1 hypothetical protein [Gordonia amicalis]MDJ0452139.1 hypothetical protein [Gordonia amicalis]MDV6305766.1 hypothetical protein [Gordonia amicalis]MDV7074752.1 hypothetical protein [Gordonia amicalis]
MTTANPTPQQIADSLSRFLASVDDQQIEIKTSERAAIEGAIVALRLISDE